MANNAAFAAFGAREEPPPAAQAATSPGLPGEVGSNADFAAFGRAEATEKPAISREPTLRRTR
jgi:acetyl esterase/lipase